MRQQLDLCEGDITICDGAMTSSLKETCPCCGLVDCHFHCDESQMEDSPESENDVESRLNWNRFCDGLESLILALACAGYDVTAEKFQEAVQTAINAGADNL